MTEMRSASFVQHFRKVSAESVIRSGYHCVGRDSFRETGPARAGVKLDVGAEQCLLTADAIVRAECLTVVILTRESFLGATFPGHAELLANWWRHSVSDFRTLLDMSYLGYREDEPT